MGNMAQVVEAFTHPAPPLPIDKYSGFPWWYALVVEPNHERRVADWLQDRVRITVYWPNFQKQVRCRGDRHRAVTASVISGMLFVPIDLLPSIWRKEIYDEKTLASVRRRFMTQEELFRLAHICGLVRGNSGTPLRISKSDIEEVRGMEAQLNLPPPPAVKAVDLKIGDHVKFKNEVYAAFMGTGIIIEVASDARIGVEVNRMFGGKRKIIIPAHEIELVATEDGDNAAPGQSPRRR